MKYMIIIILEGYTHEDWMFGLAQGTRHKAQDTRHKTQGTRHKTQGKLIFFCFILHVK